MNFPLSRMILVLPKHNNGNIPIWQNFMLILLHEDIKTFLIILINILSATMKLNLMVRIWNGMTLITIFQVIFYFFLGAMFNHNVEDHGSPQLFVLCGFLVRFSPSIYSEISSRLYAASRFLFCLQSVIFSKPFFFFLMPFFGLSCWEFTDLTVMWHRNVGPINRC